MNLEFNLSDNVEWGKGWSVQKQPPEVFCKTSLRTATLFKKRF